MDLYIKFKLCEATNTRLRLDQEFENRSLKTWLLFLLKTTSTDICPATIYVKCGKQSSHTKKCLENQTKKVARPYSPQTKKGHCQTKGLNIQPRLTIWLFVHSIYIRTVSSQHLLFLCEPVKLVYRLFGQNKMYHTLDVCQDQQGRNCMYTVNIHRHVIGIVQAKTM